MKNVSNMFIDPTNPNVNPEHVLEDMFSLYKSRNCLGKPMFRVWIDKDAKKHSQVSEKGRKLDQVTEEQIKSTRKLTELISKL